MEPASSANLAASSANLVASFAVLGATLGAFKTLIWVGDRLWKRETQPTVLQSESCKFQHSALKEDMRSQSVVIKEAFKEQNDNLKEMVKAFQSSVNDSNLRHQIVVDKLDAIHRDIRDRR